MRRVLLRRTVGRVVVGAAAVQSGQAERQRWHVRHRTCGSGGSDAMLSSVHARSWDSAGARLTMITPVTSAASPPA